MHRLTFYPLGNADTLFIDLEGGRVLIFDYADMRDPNDRYDRRWDIKTDISDKLEKKNRDDVDVFCISHLDNDHVCKSVDFFWLEHAQKYQGAGRYKIKELWVPAGAITEEGCDDAARTWRAEARYRLKNGQRIRVFGRPERLKQWLKDNGLTLESRQHLITDAGRLIPGFTKATDGVEFFLHSPHAHRINQCEVEDRNQDCVVVQATFLAGGAETRLVLAGDATWMPMEDIVRISKSHGNEARLEWDLFKLPHHSSYLSLSDLKGTTKTDPKPLIKEWFEDYAANRAIAISTSEKIGSTDQTQPPHFQAANYYKDAAAKVRGKYIVTMEHPTIGEPKPLVIKIDGYGPAVETIAASAVSTSLTQNPPRAGGR